jgi:hypothetical protein
MNKAENGYVYQVAILYVISVWYAELMFIYIKVSSHKIVT